MLFLCREYNLLINQIYAAESLWARVCVLENTHLAQNQNKTQKQKPLAKIKSSQTKTREQIGPKCSLACPK